MKSFEKVIGTEGAVWEVSNELMSLGAEDWCEFGNMDEIIESGSVVLATDECGEEHIQVFFEVVSKNTEEYGTEDTVIKVVNVEEF